MSTWSLDNEQGIHVSHKIAYDGVNTDWDTSALDISSISNEASTFDQQRRVSDVTIRMSDIDGSIWNVLGDGTTAFGKGISVITTIGGQYDTTTFGQVEGYGFTGTTGGTQFTTHIGSVVEVSKSGRAVMIRSKNNMERLNELTFKWPVELSASSTVITPDLGTAYEDYGFDAVMTKTEWLSIMDECGWDVDDNKLGCTFIAYGANIADSEPEDATGLYSGTVITYPDKYKVMTDAWYRDNTPLKMKGTFLGTFQGTIRTEEDARRYGFTSLAEAFEAEVEEASGMRYPIGKLRFQYPNGTTLAFNRLKQASKLTLSSDYTSVLSHLIAGRFIYRKFATTDLDSTTWGQSTKISAFNTFTGTILPKDDGVIEHIDDIVRTTSAMFSVNSNNKFEYLAYGPVEIIGALGTILNKDVIESSYTNRKEDAYNAFEIHYKYDSDKEAYGSYVRGTLSSWSIDEERLLKIESKWMVNDNEVEIFLSQVRSKYLTTAPVAFITTPLNKAGIEVADLVSVTDIDSGINEKILQVRKYTKDFPNSKTVEFEMLDGNSVYAGRGWAFWGTEITAGGLIEPTAVTTSSTSGFANGSDEVDNINETYYGTAYKWW